MYYQCILGSPAERAELLVGDEIIEVNGKCLDDASHGEVIAYIHKVSKFIFLKIIFSAIYNK